MKTMSRPDTLAEVARRASAGESTFDVALRELLDHFYLHPGARQAALDPAPEILADPRHNATLGGVAEYLARRWGLRIPAWTEHPSRFLDRPYFPTPIEDLKAMLLAQSPLAFRRRLIFVEAEPLRRATLPRG
jgi:hypothetical protein